MGSVSYGNERQQRITTSSPSSSQYFLQNIIYNMCGGNTHMNSNTYICQSCGMPMEKASDFGTEIDGNQNNEYCCYCYQKGTFTSLDLTLSQMIEKLIPMASQMGMTEVEARKMAENNLPKLKRWAT
jgi:hypothetical protein